MAGVSAGSLVDIRYKGPMSYAGWNWEPGAPIYASTNGAITQTPPTNGYLVVVGHAISSDTILVDLERSPRRVYIKSLSGTLVSIPNSESGIAYPNIAVLKDTGEEVSVVTDWSDLAVVISSLIPLDNHIAVLT